MSARTRGNGHEAGAWSALADLEPQLADAVVELLGQGGIAAYAAPVDDHRSTSYLPARTVDRPLDRVWCDSDRLPQARRLLVDRLAALRSEVDASVHEQRGAGEPPDGGSEPSPGAAPGGPAGSPPPGTAGGSDQVPDEQAWAEILQAWDSPAAEPDRPRREPAAEDSTAPRPDAGPDVSLDGGWAPYVDPPVGPRGRRRDEARDERRDERRDESEHFVPPVPPPLPPTDAVSRWAWLGVLGTPVLLFLLTLLGTDIPGWVALLLVGGFVGGFVTLVARMGDRPPRDSGPDDGAVV